MCFDQQGAHTSWTQPLFPQNLPRTRLLQNLLEYFILVPTPVSRGSFLCSSLMENKNSHSYPRLKARELVQKYAELAPELDLKENDFKHPKVEI